jgi:hypothetical protein
MNNTVTFKIDSTSVCGTLVDIDTFIKLFKELETLMYSDNREYWVLYDEQNAFPWSIGEYKEIFWCIPTSSIDFIKNESGWGWHIASGVGVVGRVTLDEEPNDYDRSLIIFDTFKDNIDKYMLSDKRADEYTFALWKVIKYDMKAADEDVTSDNKVCFIT